MSGLKRKKAIYQHYHQSTWGGNENDRRLLLKAVEDCIRRAFNSSLLGWDNGFRIFFRRLSDEYTKEIRDSISLWYRGTLPPICIPQKKGKDPEQRAKMGEKLDTLFMWRYFIYGLVLSVTSFFAVIKGETDILMLYNGAPHQG
jgi:hypothetical protein